MKFRNILPIYLFTLGLLFGLSAVAMAAEPVPIAQVILVTGEVKAIQKDKQERILKRRSPIYQGDLLVTGKESKIQIRFTDEGVMSLRANTQIRMDTYAYNKDDAKQNKSVSTLLKGGFRSITGAITKRNADDYKINTPVAIIGVRGTNFTAILEGHDLFVSVWAGDVLLSNGSGLLRLGRAETFRHAVIRSNSERPLGLATAPGVVNPACR